MNNKRREILSKAITHLESALDIIDSVRFDEKYAFRSLPEGFQNSARGEAIEEAIDHLTDAIFNIKDARKSVNEAMK